MNERGISCDTDENFRHPSYQKTAHEQEDYMSEKQKTILKTFLEHGKSPD